MLTISVLYLGILVVAIVLFALLSNMTEYFKVLDLNQKLSFGLSIVNKVLLVTLALLSMGFIIGYFVVL